MDRAGGVNRLANESRFQRLWRRSPGDWARFAEAYFRLGVACLAIRWVRFGRLSAGLGVPNQESSTAADPEFEARVGRIHWALDAAARRTPWQSTCLICALAGHSMLHRRRIPSTLYLGVNLHPAGSRDLSAHAWLRSGPCLVAGGKEKEGFTAVACFADLCGGLKERP